MGIGVEKYSGISSQLIQNVSQKNEAVKADSYGIKKDTYEHVDQTSSAQTQGTSETKLSEKAQKVLDELRQKYGNTDFFAADYSSDEEAGQILSNSTKEYGVVITPEELEKMADDEDYKNSVIGTISDSEGKLSDYKNSLSDDEKSQVKSLGVSIAADGTVKYFAEIEKQTQAAADRIKEAKEKKSDSSDKTEDTGVRKKYDIIKKYVNGSSLDELSAAIDNFISSSSEDGDLTGQTSHIDYQL